MSPDGFFSCQFLRTVYIGVILILTDVQLNKNRYFYFHIYLSIITIITEVNLFDQHILTKDKPRCSSVTRLSQEIPLPRSVSSKRDARLNLKGRIFLSVKSTHILRIA